MDHCNVLICTTNQTIIPWIVVNVKPLINFEELLVQIKSGAFSTISASLELSSSIFEGSDTNWNLVHFAWNLKWNLESCLGI